MGFLILRFRCNCAFWLVWSQSSWQMLYQPRRAERAACQPAVINHPSERRRFVSAERTHSSIQTASGCEDAAGVLNQPPPDRPRASASTQECRGVFLTPSASPPNIHSLQPFGGDRLQLANAWKALKERCWFAVTSWKAGPQSKQLHVGYILAILSDFVFAGTLI